MAKSTDPCRCGGTKTFYAKSCWDCLSYSRIEKAKLNLKCSSCKLEKARSDFYPDRYRISGKTSECITCCAAYSQDPRRKRASYKHRLLKKYGLTFEDYDALWSTHMGCCASCKTLLTYAHKDTHIDHNHATGKIRGLLCRSCNQTLGFAKEDIDRLHGLISYIKQHS